MADARRSVRAALHEHGFVGDVTAVLLLVSELVTNAIVHAAPPCHVCVQIDTDSVRVSVEDGDPARMPAITDRSHFDRRQLGGEGLRLVDELADEWGGRTISPDTKSVWFTMAASREGEWGGHP